MEIAITGFIFLMGFSFLFLGVNKKDRVLMIISLLFFLILSFIFLFEGIA